MSKYQCNLCNKTFPKKYNYDRHLKRQTPCVKVSIRCNDCLATFTQKSSLNYHKKYNCKGVIRSIVDKHQCKYCNKYYATLNTLDRHIKNSCPVKKAFDSHDEDVILQAIDNSRQHVANITTNNIINNNINNITNNNTVNVQNNITILPFGKEDISFITKEQWISIMDKGLNCMASFIKLLSFNKNQPQNHNMYCSDIRSPYVRIYDGDLWKLFLYDDVYMDLVNKKSDLLMEKFNEYKDVMNPPTIKRFTLFSDGIENIDQNIGLQRDLKLLLYNMREVSEPCRKIAHI